MEANLQFVYDLGLAIASGLIVLGALLGLVLGALLLFSPQNAQALQDLFNRQYSLRRALRPFEVPRHGERGFYRHHRIWGTLLVVGATVYILTWLSLDSQGIMRLAPNPLGLDRWLLDSLAIFLTAGNIFALAVGLVVFFRPSLLKGLERRANAWISTRRWSHGWERENAISERWVQRHPRTAGALLSLGSLFVLASFSLVWLSLGMVY